MSKAEFENWWKEHQWEFCRVEDSNETIERIKAAFEKLFQTYNLNDDLEDDPTENGK